MSDLLGTAIEAHGGLERWNQLESVSAHLIQGGGRELESVTVADTPSGERTLLPASALFVFTGAVPHTEWLERQLVTDRAGFLLTGRDLEGEDLAEHNGNRPLSLETSRPGIFAVGDVRSGSIKRVASAVGEGSMAVRLVHERQADLRAVAERT